VAALTLARAGVSSEAQQMAQGLAMRFPRDTLITGYWLRADGLEPIYLEGALARAQGRLL
jgi:hypothetical protein